ncbi:MAG: glycosyltransferase family 4 protein [Lachnospiraceae bacterium]|jgi:galacturonosyltransferase|nr:glycosyltransferase family 4 protein [Lachnospiraceae bacterium]
MRILILANSSAGLYDFRSEFIERLLRDHQLTVSVPDSVKAEQLAKLGCEVITTAINRRGMNPVEDYRLYREYGRLLRAVQPELVLTYTIKPNIYGGLNCRRARIPYLATITGLGSTFQHRSLVRRIVIGLYRRGLKRAACVFFQNEENQAIFERFRIRGKSSRLVSGSGVNLKKHFMEPYRLDDQFYFLYVGRVMKEKGIEEFLTAAETLHSEKVHFQIVGYCDEDYQERLDNLEIRGYIQQLGFRPDIHEILAQASAVVLPTYHEGMSNVLMEASSTGRPVIASNISGCREIFTEGETGLGFNPGDSGDLIRALRQFMAIPASDRAMMGRRARERMGKYFDRERVIDAYIEEIEKLTKG